MEPFWGRVEAALSGLPHAVAGGVATARYMPQRATLDLDVVIAAADAPRVSSALQLAGFLCSGTLSIAETAWLAPGGERGDVLHLDEPWAGAALAAAMADRDAALDLPVLGLPYLVLLKLRAGRPQDLADVSRMMGCASDAAVDGVWTVVARFGSREDAEDLEQIVVLGRLEHGG